MGQDVTGATPLLTIGVPVYNGERFLAQALDSMLVQDFTDYQMIISDNASTDRTPQILADYARRDPRIRVITQSRNLGSAANWNLLVDYSTTPYFKWAAADDLCAPSYLSRCIEALEAHPEAVLAYAKTTMIDEAGERLFDYEDRLHILDPDPAVRLRQYALRRGLNNAGHGVFRTAVLRQISLFGPQVSADLTMMAEVLLHGGFYEVPERLFFRRKAETSVGIGNLSRREKQHFMSPGSRGSPLPTKLRVSLDTERMIARSSLSARDRVRTGWAYAAARTERQVRTRGGALRRSLASRLEGARTEPRR